jgi:hypothetical protein
VAFLESEIQQIEHVIGKYCRGRIPEHLWPELEVRYRIDGQAVTMYERRPRFHAPGVKPRTPGEFTVSPFARFRFNRQTGMWTLYWSDSRGRWHEYDRLQPTPELRFLLAEVDRDPTGIFWG